MYFALNLRAYFSLKASRITKITREDMLPLLFRSNITSYFLKVLADFLLGSEELLSTPYDYLLVLSTPSTFD